MEPLSPTQTKTFVIEALKRQKIPYISGPPGIGKSEIVAQVAQEFDLKLIDIRLSQMQPEDLAGIPVTNPKTGRASYYTFDVFPLEGDPLPVDANGNEMNGWLIFLDELSSASEEVMAAIYKLLLGKQVGGHNLHKKAAIVGAGNRECDSAIARALPDTLITRMLPITMKVSSKDWLKWSAESGRGNSIVEAYIKKFPDSLLRTTDPNNRKELEPYATPRGWGVVSDLMNYIDKHYAKKPITDSAGIPVKNGNEFPDPLEVDYHMITSAIGHIEAIAFKEYYINTTKLPNPWDIAQSPGSTIIPPTNAGKVTVIENLVPYYIESPEAIRDAILQYINRMEEEYRATFLSNIRGKLGSTVSDKRLVTEISNRLNIPENIVAINSDDTASNTPFFMDNSENPYISSKRNYYNHQKQLMEKKIELEKYTIDWTREEKIIKSLYNSNWNKNKETVWDYYNVVKENLDPKKGKFR